MLLCRLRGTALICDKFGRPNFTNAGMDIVHGCVVSAGHNVRSQCLHSCTMVLMHALAHQESLDAITNYYLHSVKLMIAWSLFSRAVGYTYQKKKKTRCTQERKMEQYILHR
jgi:hypothetical protein